MCRAGETAKRVLVKIRSSSSLRKCRFLRNRIFAVTVGAAIMSREVVSRAALLQFLLLSATAFHEASSRVLPDECFSPEVAALEDYLSTLDLQEIPTVNVMIGGFECPATRLPFGALKSDWARLMLLRNAQVEGSVLKEKLDSLFRILAIAYNQMEMRVDVGAVGSTESSAKRRTERTEAGKDGLLSPGENETSGTDHEDIAERWTFTRERYFEEDPTERSTFPGIDATETKERDESTLSKVYDVSGSTVPLLETSSETSLYSEADPEPRPIGSTVTVHYTDDRSNIAAFDKVSPDASVILSEQTSPFEEGTTEIGDTSTSSERGEIYTTRWVEEAETSVEYISTDGSFANGGTAAEESKVDGKLKSTTKETLPSKPLINEDRTNGLVTGDNYGTSDFPTVEIDGEETTAESSIPLNTESSVPSTSASTDVDDRETSVASIAQCRPNAFCPETTPAGSDDRTSVVESEETSSQTDSVEGSSVAIEIETTSTVVVGEGTTRFENDDPLFSSSTASTDSAEETTGTSAKGDPEVTATGSVSSEFSDDYSFSETLPVESTTAENSRPTTLDLRVLTRSTSTSSPRRSKLKKLVVIERTPACNDFWRRVALWRMVPSTSTVPTARTGVEYPEDEPRSRKRGSSNTDVEKSFRWFYGLYRSNGTADGRGIDVDCGEKRGARSLPP